MGTLFSRTGRKPDDDSLRKSQMPAGIKIIILSMTRSDSCKQVALQLAVDGPSLSLYTCKIEIQVVTCITLFYRN